MGRQTRRLEDESSTIDFTHSFHRALNSSPSTSVYTTNFSTRVSFQTVCNWVVVTPVRSPTQHKILTTLKKYCRRHPTEGKNLFFHLLFFVVFLLLYFVFLTIFTVSKQSLFMCFLFYSYVYREKLLQLI